METTILPVRPGSLSVKDRAALRKAGVIVIEHENPSEVRLITPGLELGGSDLFHAALKAIVDNNDTNTRRQFLSAMLQLSRHQFDSRRSGSKGE